MTRIDGDFDEPLLFRPTVTLMNSAPPEVVVRSGAEQAYGSSKSLMRLEVRENEHQALIFFTSLDHHTPRDRLTRMAVALEGYAATLRHRANQFGMVYNFPEGDKEPIDGQ